MRTDKCDKWFSSALWNHKIPARQLKNKNNYNNHQEVFLNFLKISSLCSLNKKLSVSASGLQRGAFEEQFLSSKLGKELQS